MMTNLLPLGEYDVYDGAAGRVACIGVLQLNGDGTTLGEWD